MADTGHDEPLAHLRRQRAVTLEKLRRVAPELVERLEGWDKAIAALSDQQPSTTYARHFSGADALVEYLTANGPTDRLTAIRAVAQGGWAADRKDPAGILHDAVDYQLGKAHNAKLVSLGGDVIGTPEQKKAKRRDGR